MSTSPMTTTEMNNFKTKLDKFFQRIEEHQENFTELDSKQCWKMQDIKSKIAELMNIL